MQQFLLEILCLAETKVKSQLVQMGFCDVFKLPPSGRKDGLVVAWRKGVVRCNFC